MRTRPYDLNVSVVVHTDDAHEIASSMHRPPWWLITVLVLLAVFLIGVGVTGGIR